MNRIKILFVLLGLCLLSSCDESNVGVNGITSTTTEKDAIEIIKEQLGTDNYEKEQNEYGWAFYSFDDGMNNDIKYSEIKLSIKDGKVINYSYSMGKEYEERLVECLAKNKINLKTIDYPVKCYTSESGNSAILIVISPDKNELGFIQVFNKK